MLKSKDIQKKIVHLSRFFFQEKKLIIIFLIINIIVFCYLCLLNLHHYQNIVSNSPGQLIINKITGNYCIFVPNKSVRNAMVITRNFEVCTVDNLEKIILP